MVPLPAAALFMHKHGMLHGTFHAISACGPSSRPSRGIDPSEPSPLPICRQSAGSLLSFNLKRLVGPLPRSLVGLPTCPFSSLIFNQLFFNPGPSAIWQNTPFELAFKRITFDEISTKFRRNFEFSTKFRVFGSSSWGHFGF